MSARPPPNAPFAEAEEPLPLERGSGASELVPASALSRRRFVWWLGASVSSLGVDACSKPPRQELLSYVHRPPEVVPGVARYFATSSERQGYAVGILAESHEGRPTKIEGHPEHPASLGAAGIHEQSAILSLYDPERAKAIHQRGEPRSFEEFAAAFGPSSNAPWIASGGKGLALLLKPSSSAVEASLVERLRQRYPALSIFYHSTSGVESRWEGAQAAFGAAMDPQYRFDRAKVVVALDADFLIDEPMSLSWARRFMRARRAVKPGGSSNRLYVVESHLTVTGAAAEHRLAVAASEVFALAAALLSAVLTLSPVPAASGVDENLGHFLGAHPRRAWVEAAARDLAAHRGECVVVVGARQPPAVHVLGHALNEALGSAGTIVSFTRPPMPDAGSSSYRPSTLLAAIDAGKVDTLFVLGPNPAYTLPGAAHFSSRLQKIRERVVLSLYEDETARHSTWFLPAAHPLERFGDGRGYDGTVTFAQPLISPLYDGKSVAEVLAALLGDFERNGRHLLRDRFDAELARRRSETTLDAALRRGLLPDTVSPASAPAVDWKHVASAVANPPPSAPGVEVDFALDPRIGDGDGANVAWLQELAEPITKIVWGNAALLSGVMAQRLGVTNGDVVALRAAGGKIELPAFVQPGHADGAVTVLLGHGRRAGGSVGRGVGTDAAPLRSVDSPWFTAGVQIAKTGSRVPIVTTQTEANQHDRPIALRRTLAALTADPGFAGEFNRNPLSILPNRLHGSPQWGMSIDLNACTGCSACIVACAVENNIPVVGKENVALFREMYWIRLDRYYGGEPGAPVVDLQPMLCQHCEKAPCEYVCPVNATVHSPDGLNEMIYNRCVGTRFCSNNCPYKVRRFNFFSYNQDVPETERMGKNPDVTVRGRGVMEKCTYCVQRIRRAQIDAELEKRPLRDGDVRTACQQTCPTQAIVFGNVADLRSEVSRLHADVRTYAVLDDVGTRPRTRYLARISNPNPELET